MPNPRRSIVRVIWFECFLTCLMVFGAAAITFAKDTSDWQQWRGPEQDGSSTETGLPTEFSSEKNLVWRTPMAGRSGSTPIVVGDRLFVTSATEDKELELWALNASSGKLLWKHTLGDGDYFRMKHNMSSPSAVSDGQTVWAMTGTGVVSALTLEGKELWKRNLQTEIGPFGLNHGYGASPLLHEGVLYVPVLHGMKTDDPSYVIALAGDSGKTLWHAERPTDALMESPDAYTTPVIWKHHGTAQLVITGGDYATGHDLATGKELWRVGGMNPGQGEDVPRGGVPRGVSGDMLFVPTRVKPFQALRATAVHKALPSWCGQNERGPDVPTPTLHDGLLYVLEDKGILGVYEAETGKAVYERSRLATGTYSASPLAADGKLYALSEEGVMTVVRLGREFEVLATNELEGFALATPVVSKGRLFVRTADWLYCFAQQ